LAATSKSVVVSGTVRLANTPLKGEESAQDNRILARNSAKYSPM